MLLLDAISETSSYTFPLIEIEFRGRTSLTNISLVISASEAFWNITLLAYLWGVQGKSSFALAQSINKIHIIRACIATATLSFETCFTLQTTRNSAFSTEIIWIELMRGFCARAFIRHYIRERTINAFFTLIGFLATCTSLDITDLTWKKLIDFIVSVTYLAYPRTSTFFTIFFITFLAYVCVWNHVLIRFTFTELIWRKCETGFALFALVRILLASLTTFNQTESAIPLWVHLVGK